MRVAEVGVVALALTTSLFAQQQSIPSKVTTEGPCSPNVLFNEDKVVITCHGVVDPELRKQIDKAVAILNEIYRRKGSDSKAIHGKLDEILQSLQNLELSKQARRLTEQENALLKRELSKAPQLPVKINCVLGNDGCLYAEDLVAAFKSAGWDHVLGFSQAVYGKTLVGVQFTVSNKFRDRSWLFADLNLSGEIEKVLPPEMRMLFEILFKAGVLPERTIFVDPSIDAETVQIRIGLRE